MASSKSSSSKHAWMAMGALCVVSLVASGITWNTISIFADPIVSEWGILRTQYMIVPTLIAGLNMVISMTLFGTLEAKFGIRKLMVAGLLLMGVALGVFACANGLVMLYTAATLWGLGLSMEANSMRNAAVMHWFKKRTGTMISIVAGVGQGTGIIFVAIFGYLVTIASWRVLLWACCICSVVAAVVCWFLYKGSPEDLGEKPLYADEADGEDAAVVTTEEDGISAKAMMKTWQFWAHMVGWIILGIAADAIMANLVLIAIDYGYAAQSGLVLSVCLLASTILSPIGGWICDKWGSKAHIVLGMAGVIFCCIVLRMGTMPLWLLFVVAAVLGFGWNTSVIPAANCTVETFGRRDFAKKSTLMVSMQCLGVAIAPTLYSAFYDFGGGYAAGNVFVIVCAVIAIAVFCIANNKRVNFVK